VLDATPTEQERDLWLDRCAREIVRRGMETPATFLLELHRPLAFLGGQALIVLSPFVGALVGLDNAMKLARLVEDRANVDRLLDRVAELAAERTAGSTSRAETPDAP
jgi:hypothetical protein